MEENVTIAGELLKSRSLDIGFSVGVYIASLRATHDVCFAKLIPAQEERARALYVELISKRDKIVVPEISLLQFVNRGVLKKLAYLFLTAEIESSVGIFHNCTNCHELYPNTFQVLKFQLGEGVQIRVWGGTKMSHPIERWEQSNNQTNHPVNQIFFVNLVYTVFPQIVSAFE